MGDPLRTPLSRKGSATSSRDHSHAPSHPHPHGPSHGPVPAPVPAPSHHVNPVSNPSVTAPVAASVGSESISGLQWTSRPTLSRPRLTSLHQVTTPQTPESSPISPSMYPLSRPGSSRQSGWGGGLGGPPRRASVSSPTLFYAHSSSVSTLGFDHQRVQNTETDLSSSSDEEVDFGYDSDERMEIPRSRRASTSSNLVPSSSRRGSVQDEDTNMLGGGLMGLGLSFRSRIERAGGRAGGASGDSSSGSSGASPVPQNNGGSSHSSMQFEPAVRVGSSSRGLRPKAKSLLRISKELQEEESPFDYEVQREGEIAMAFRGDDFRGLPIRRSSQNSVAAVAAATASREAPLAGSDEPLSAITSVIDDGIKSNDGLSRVGSGMSLNSSAYGMSDADMSDSRSDRVERDGRPGSGGNIEFDPSRLDSQTDNQATVSERVNSVDPVDDEHSGPNRASAAGRRATPDAWPDREDRLKRKASLDYEQAFKRRAVSPASPAGSSIRGYKQVQDTSSGLQNMSLYHEGS